MNKKLFTLLISTLSLLMAFTSCSDEAFDVDSVNKQTILAFFPWTGSTEDSGLKEYLLHDLDSICQGIVDKQGLKSVRVMVFLSETANKSTLYDLQYDAANRQVSRVPVKHYEGNSYCTAEGIAEILNEVKLNAEALNYALIIGAHGNGWTYAEDWTNYPYKVKPSLGKDKEGDPPLTRYFGTVSKDMRDNMMDVGILAEGIKRSGLKMQYILFDACYMGNVETAYELKDATNYLIASSSEILAMGLPYRTLWSSLSTDRPSYSGIVSTSVQFYKNQKQPWINLSAIDCRQMDDLARLMKQINSQYSLSSAISLDSIQPLDGFDPHLFFDMKVYVDSLCPAGVLKDQFMSQLKNAVKSSAYTKEVITSLPTSNTKYLPVNAYCGLSISDPSQHIVAIKGKEKTNWWKATHE